jgi:prevent-host-death family protein
MREITVREADQNFSQVIAAAGRGETIIVTKNGRPVAKIAPQSGDRASDPEWRASFAGAQEKPAIKARFRLSCGNRHGRR